MKITKVSIENFKCYKNEVQAELAPITLIYGENGGGKSSLLQSISAGTSNHGKQGKGNGGSKGNVSITMNSECTTSLDFSSGVKPKHHMCKYAEEIFDTIFEKIRCDQEALTSSFEEKMNELLDVIKLRESISHSLCRNGEAFMKEYRTIYPAKHDEFGHFLGFRCEKSKAFSEKGTLVTFPKFEFSKYVVEDKSFREACEIKDIEEVKKAICGKWSFSRWYKDGFPDALDVKTVDVVNSLAEYIAKLYFYSAECRVNITMYDDKNSIYEDIKPYPIAYTIIDSSSDHFSSSYLMKYLSPPLEKYIHLEGLIWHIKNALRNKLSRHVDKFKAPAFVGHPRGYDTLLEGKVDAKNMKRLMPLLTVMFPDIGFDIRAEDNEKRIYIYDDVLDAEVRMTECGYGYSQIIPVLLALADSDNEIVCISEPETHIHPRLQASIGSLFLDVYRDSGKQIIAETHSEHIVLRIQRLIRCGEMKPEEVSVLYVSKTPEGSTIKRLHLDEKGRFIDAWPQGFFAERDEELFGGKPA